MRVTSTEANGVDVLRIESNSLEFHHAEALERALLAAWSADHPAILDFSLVRYLDHFALQAIVTALRQAPAKVMLAEVDPAVMTLFQLTRLDQVFSFAPRVDDAARTLRPSLKPVDHAS